MKKRLLKVIIVIGVVFAIGFTIAKAIPSPIEKIKIVPDSIGVTQGVRFQLQVEGYYADGTKATEEDIENLKIVWNYQTEKNCFTVDSEGWIEAIAENGIGNVWAESADGKLATRPITVFVK